MAIFQKLHSGPSFRVADLRNRPGRELRLIRRLDHTYCRQNEPKMGAKLARVAA